MDMTKVREINPCISLNHLVIFPDKGCEEILWTG